MDNKSMSAVKNMVIGLAVGASAAAAGAVYLAENKQKTKRAIRKMKDNADRITDAGEEIVEDITK